MDNWFQNQEDIKNKTINEIMGELEYLVSESKTANYWIDKTHNVFAFINDNGEGDSWIEIHYELYDHNEDIIGDLMVLDTESIDLVELKQEVETVVNNYYGI